MLSERSYWIILTVFFTGFAFLIWFILIPYGVIEYNLGVNLFTSSIFMVFTIVLLGWLLNLRANSEWELIKNRILEQLRGITDSLFDLLQNLCEVNTQGEDNKGVKILKLSNLENVHLRPDVETYLSKDNVNLEGYILCLEEIVKYLDDIERYYSRFLEAKLMDAVMKLNESTRNLAFNLKRLKRIGWGPYKEKEKEYIESTITPFVKETLVAIYEMYNVGVDIVPERKITRFPYLMHESQVETVVRNREEKH
jgi:heme oxygenase